MALGQQQPPTQPNMQPSAQQPTQQQQQQPAPQATQQPAQQPASTRALQNGVPSIISADLTIKGTLVTERDVQLDGRVEGDIRVAGLILGEKALVQGDIYAEEAVIRGRVEGSIRARKVQLMSTAHVEGNIVHNRQLSVETGAHFEGNCRHSDNPMKEKEAGENGPRRAAKPESGNGTVAAE